MSEGDRHHLLLAADTNRNDPVSDSSTSRRAAIQRLAFATACLTGASVATAIDEASRGCDENTGGQSSASTDNEETPMPAGDSKPQPGLPTLGGMQFWGDLRFFRGFRIQKNVLTGHYRLLDAANRRYCAGTLGECEMMLKTIQQEHGLSPDEGHAVIYLHGIGRSSRSLSPIMKSMSQAEYVHVPFEYPSTRVPLAESAQFLHSVIESLTSVSKISFVVHSMGGLVVRRYLKDHQDPRIHRMVMMGTPNHGAELADMLQRNFLFKTIYGPAGQELVSDSGGTIKTLPVPSFEFGIIAGGRGDDRGFNRLLPGDDDGTVTVASARLPGAADFLRIPKIHSFLMSDATSIAAVQHFLEHGRFFPDRAAEPIVASSPNAQATGTTQATNTDAGTEETATEKPTESTTSEQRRSGKAAD